MWPLPWVRLYVLNASSSFNIREVAVVTMHGFSSESLCQRSVFVHHTAFYSGYTVTSYRLSVSVYGRQEIWVDVTLLRSRCICTVRRLSVNVCAEQEPLLTRALEGGGAKNALPSGFSRVTEKRRRAAPPFFQYLLIIELHTLCKNFNLRSPKVRSPGQVIVKNGFLTEAAQWPH